MENPEFAGKGFRPESGHPAKGTLEIENPLRRTGFRPLSGGRDREGS
jgi:hypothetical protein